MGIISAPIGGTPEIGVKIRNIFTCWRPALLVGLYVDAPPYRRDYMFICSHAFGIVLGTENSFCQEMSRILILMRFWKTYEYRQKLRFYRHKNMNIVFCEAISLCWACRNTPYEHVDATLCSAICSNGYALPYQRDYIFKCWRFFEGG